MQGFIFLIIGIFCERGNSISHESNNLISNSFPIHLYKNYTILENIDFKIRTFDMIKKEYHQIFTSFFNTCEKANECKNKTFNKYTEDHIKSLKMINFLRNLAGISKIITEDDIMIQQFHKAASNIQKIDKDSVNHIKSDQTAEKHYYHHPNDQITSRSKLLFIQNSISIFDSIYTIFTTEKVDEQTLILHPNMEKVKFWDDSIKPSIEVFLQNPKKQQKIKFVSWPPEGVFPMSFLSRHWHVRHDDFRKNELSDVKIIIQRDDGIELKVNHTTIDDDILIIRLTKYELKKCEIKKTISVTVINDRMKQMYRFSFKLVDDNSISLFQSGMHSNISDGIQNSNDLKKGISNTELALIMTISFFISLFIIASIFFFLGATKSDAEDTSASEDENNERNQANLVPCCFGCCYCDKPGPGPDCVDWFAFYLLCRYASCGEGCRCDHGCCALDCGGCNCGDCNCDGDCDCSGLDLGGCDCTIC